MTDLTAGLRVSEPAGRWVLLATILGSSMAMLDGTVVNLALPRIAEDLDASFTDLQWIMNGYTLALASLILLGGALGDRYGRRRVFLIGAALFTVASLACAVAPSVGALIAARVAQGVAAAMLTPGSLAILQASFEPGERGRAIGTWSGLGGVATAIGPFLGGWLVDAASWRWIFLLNLPLGIAVLAVGTAHVPESRDPDATGRLDLRGAALGALGLAGLTLGLTEQSTWMAVAGAALLVAFVVFEMRVDEPLVPMSMFRSATFSGTNAVTLFLYGALGVTFFMLGLVLQGPLGYTPLQAGAATMPVTLAMLLLSARAGALAERIGPRIPMTAGPLLVAVAMLMLTGVSPGDSYVTAVLPGIVVFGLGLALTVAPLTMTALAAVEDRHAGIASGVNNAVGTQRSTPRRRRHPDHRRLHRRRGGRVRRAARRLRPGDARRRARRRRRRRDRLDDRSPARRARPRAGVALRGVRPARVARHSGGQPVSLTWWHHPIGDACWPGGPWLPESRSWWDAHETPPGHAARARRGDLCPDPRRRSLRR